MKRLSLLATLITVSLGVQAYAAAPKVTLNAENEVKPGCAVLLKDIATIQAPKAIAEKIGDINVTRAPIAGQSRVMGASLIRQKINLAVPKPVVKTVGPDEIRITGKCVKVTAAELTEAAKQFALANMPKDNREYDLTIDSISGEVIAPADTEVKIEPEMAGYTLHTGLNPVRLCVKADGRTIATKYASVRVKATALVLVASQVIERGTPLTSENTAWDTRDVSKLPGAIVQDGSDKYQELIARTMIRPGTVISSTDTELPPAVKQGDTISLTVWCGNVILKTSAEARQGGKIGDTIRVTTPVSSGDIRVKITEPGVAEIKM